MKTMKQTYCHTIRILLSALLISGPSIASTQETTTPTVPPEPTEPAGPPADKAPPSEASPKKNVLTLDQCLKRALANSKKIEAEKHRIDMLSEKQEQLWWLPLSNFSLEGGVGAVPDKTAYVNDDGAVTAPSDYAWRDRSWGPTFHISFKGALPIPTSKQYPRAKEALAHAKKAKQAMLPSIEHEIAFNVHQAFHGVVGAREMLYTLSEGRKHLTKARKKVEENLEKQEGNDTQIDLIKLKVFESRLDAMQKQVEQIEKTALAAMRFLVGAEAEENVDLPEDPQDIVQREITALDDYKKTAVERRPEFEALRHGVKALEAKVKTTETAFVPKLAVVFSVGAGYTPGVKVCDRENREDCEKDTPFLMRNSYNYGSIIPSVGLVMKVPLDIGINIHKMREAKSELKALLADKELAMEGVLLEVETTYIEATSTMDIISSLNKARKTAKGWLSAAAQNHAIGVGSTGDVKDALKEYFTIMGELHQRIGEYNIALAKLDKVTGVLLDN